MSANSPKISETDKLVAAILAAAKSARQHASQAHTDYLDNYNTFVKLLEERSAMAAERENTEGLKSWEKLGEE